MRRLALAIALACVLSGVAYAGEIPSTGVAAPSQPTTATNITTTIILTILSIVR
jgi:hypothetical protein